SSRTTNKKLAEQMEVDWRAKLHAQHFMGKKERITLREALQLFCQSKRGTANHRNLVTQQATVGCRISGGKTLDELTLHDLERYKRQREIDGVSSQTIKHELNLIRGALKYARKLGYLVTEL